MSKRFIIVSGVSLVLLIAVCAVVYKIGRGRMYGANENLSLRDEGEAAIAKPKDMEKPVDIDKWYEEWEKVLREDAEKPYPEPYEWRTAEDLADEGEETKEVAEKYNWKDNASRDEFAKGFKERMQIKIAEWNSPEHKYNAKRLVDAAGGMQECIRKQREETEKEITIGGKLHIYADNQLKEKYSIDSDTLKSNKATRKFRRDLHEYIESDLGIELTLYISNLKKSDGSYVTEDGLKECIDSYIKLSLEGK